MLEKARKDSSTRAMRKGIHRALKVIDGRLFVLRAVDAAGGAWGAYEKARKFMSTGGKTKASKKMLENIMVFAAKEREAKRKGGGGRGPPPPRASPSPRSPFPKAPPPVEGGGEPRLLLLHLLRLQPARPFGGEGDVRPCCCGETRAIPTV